MAWFSAHKSSARHNRATSGRRRLTTRLHLEALEDRSVPAISVTSLLDDGSEGTLRWAVEQANVFEGPDTLTFDPGVNGAISLLQGRITITDDLTIAGPGAEQLAISVFYNEITETTSGIVFEIATGATVSLLDLSIDNRADGVIDPLDDEAIVNAGVVHVTNCNFASNNDLGYGGGIFNEGTLTVNASSFVAGRGIFNEGTLTVADTTFSDSHGSAIWNGASATISGSTFTGNRALSDGGAIHNTGTTTITDSTFTDNSAVGAGGAIANTGVLDISGSIFTDNFAMYWRGGGAISSFLAWSSPDTTRTDVSSSTFIGNSAEQGGAISSEFIPLTVSDSTFTDNSAFRGGAIANRDAPLAISGSTFSENTATGIGGAIEWARSHIEDQSRRARSAEAILTVDNSTFWRNSANAGGALYRSDQFWKNSPIIDHIDTLPSTLMNVTIVENKATVGGGIFSQAREVPLRVGNSIIARNVATGTNLALADIATPFRVLSLGNNLFGIRGNVPAATTDLWGTVDSPLDPMLAPLGNYGGPTQTMPPLQGSPALGAGSIELAVDRFGDPLSTDQRGLPRVVNGFIDIGAYQKQPNAATLEAAVPNAPVVTLETPEGTTLTSVTALAPPPSDQRAGTGLPKNAQLPVGAFDFTVQVAAGATAQIILHLADGTPPINAYYKLNPANGKWFKFNWDAATGTGAILPGEVHPLTSNIVPPNQIVLILKDNARGDSNSTVGIIDDPGAPVYVETLQVQIDVRSTVNLASPGEIAVAMLFTDDFDPALVDVASVRFAGAAAGHFGWEDVNGDGRLDLVLHFRTQDTDLRALYERLIADDINQDGVLDSNHQEAMISLTGTTTDNELFEGTDTIDLFLSGKALRELLSKLAADGAI